MLNPYLPDGTFIPDGEVRRFGDRLYLYGSHDLYGQKSLCGGDYECWSCDPSDLADWRCEGIIYRRMQDPYIAWLVKNKKSNSFNSCLYAPDVVEVDGKYYLYYGVAMSGAGIAAAVSDTPAGPFEYLGRVRYPENGSAGKNLRENALSDNPGRELSRGYFDGSRILGGGMPMIQPNPLRPHFGLNMKDYAYDPALLLDDGHLYLYFGCGTAM